MEEEKFYIFYGATSEILSAKVSNNLKNGWKLHGNTYANVDCSVHYQPMIKEINKEEDKKEILNG